MPTAQSSLNSASIAARLDVPGATVRSQLKRGLAMLRERLDEDYGNRRVWMVALSPFAAAGKTIGESGPRRPPWERC